MATRFIQFLLPPYILFVLTAPFLFVSFNLKAGCSRITISDEAKFLTVAVAIFHDNNQAMCGIFSRHFCQ